MTGGHLRVGDFHREDLSPLVPLSRAAVRSIVARFADTDGPEEVVGIPPSGEVAVILGYIAGTPIAFHESGFVYLPADDVDPRVEAFLSDLCAELGCGIHVCVT